MKTIFGGKFKFLPKISFRLTIHWKKTQMPKYFLVKNLICFSTFSLKNSLTPKSFNVCFVSTNHKLKLLLYFNKRQKMKIIFAGIFESFFKILKFLSEVLTFLMVSELWNILTSVATFSYIYSYICWTVWLVILLWKISKRQKLISFFGEKFKILFFFPIFSFNNSVHVSECALCLT